MPPAKMTRTDQLVVHKTQEKSNFQPGKKRSSLSYRNAYRAKRPVNLVLRKAWHPSTINWEQKTYNNSRPSALYQARQYKESTHDFPALFPFLLPACKDDDEGDKGHAFHDDRERHQEAHRTPHGAEIAVSMAVSRLGEVFAGACEGGAATM